MPWQARYKLARPGCLGHPECWTAQCCNWLQSLASAASLQTTDARCFFSSCQIEIFISDTDNQHGHPRPLRHS